MIERASYLYQLRVFDEANNVVSVYDDLVSLYYRNQVNHVGICIATVPEGHALITDVSRDTLIEVFISTPGYSPGSFGEVDWYSDFLGLYRDYQIATDEAGNIYYLLYFPGTNEILTRYVNAWPAGTDRKTQWAGRSYGEIANDLVKWNATSFATTGNGRLASAAPVRGLVAAGAEVLTPTADFATTGKPLLDTLQELARSGGFDFLVQRNTVDGDLTYLECRQIAGPLGQDRSTSLYLHMSLDNLAQASYGGDQINEKTRAIVAGQGEGSTRTFEVVASDTLDDDNQYEVWVDARDKDSSELSAIGELRLGELKSKAQLTGTIAPSLGYMYKRDYGLGDLVQVVFGDISVVRKIETAEVKFDQSQAADIRLEMSDTV